MKKYNFNIPLEDRLKSKIIKACLDARTKDVETFKNENPLVSYMCVPFLKWDFTNTNIITDFRNDFEERFICFLVDRGIFKVLLIYDRKSKYLYSLMRKERFEEVKKNQIKRINKNEVHYLDLLAYLNRDLDCYESCEDIQISFFNDRSNWDELVSFYLNEIFLSRINDEVKRYITILFSDNRNGFNSVHAHVLNEKLQILYTENWSEFIEVEYLTDFEDVETDLDSEDVIISIRNDVINNNVSNSKVIDIRKTNQDNGVSDDEKFIRHRKVNIDENKD